MIKVLVIGPSINRTKGGIATVINSQLNSNPKSRGLQFEHLVTHAEGSVLTRIFYFLKSFIVLIGKRNVNLAHIHVACDGSFYRKSILYHVCKLKGIQVVIHVHGSDFDHFFRNANFLAKTLIRKTFRGCSRVLVLSKYWLQFFIENIVNDDYKIEVLYNGVDMDSFKDCTATSDNINKFLFFGRLGKRKGIYDLLEAINIIVNNNNFKDIHFYLAGDGDLEAVEVLINQYGLQRNVYLMGWLDDIKKKECLKKAYTVVLPSYSEGLPMALLESMACGKVIISTRVGGIPELVEEGKNGFLITPGDIVGLIDRLVYVVDNKKEMEQISVKNREKISKDYNIKEISNKLYSIYSKVLSERKINN